MNKYIEADKLKSIIKLQIKERKEWMKDIDRSDRQDQLWSDLNGEDMSILQIIDSIQQEIELPEKYRTPDWLFEKQEHPNDKLPTLRTRVNYAICKLQSFKPLREAIILDDYVYDESKCYRDNLLNYIHAIPESRLLEIRSYLKEKGWWPYDDVDCGEHGQPEVDLEKEAKDCWDYVFALGWDENSLMTMNYKEFLAFARHFYELKFNARNE